MNRYPPPNTRDIGPCKRCRRAIRFVHLVNGKRVPVDPEPTSFGRLVARFQPETGVWVEGAFVPNAETVGYGWSRFDPHSDSCGRRATGPSPELLARMRADIAAARAREAG